MEKEKQTEIGKKLIGFYESFKLDGKPIPVNFRTLVPELNKTERYTHLIHSYPAKLLTNIPYFFLATDALCPSDGIVLDPFCGTGTVLLEAVLSGRRGWGADSNPLAEVITEVKTTYIPGHELIDTLNTLLGQARQIKVTQIYPEAIAIWFAPSTLMQLAALQAVINGLQDERVKAFFKVCLSSVVRKVSFADPSISVPVHWNPERFSANPSRMEEVRSKLQDLQTVDVFEKFEAVCIANIDRVNTLNGKIRNGVAASIISKDARHLGIPDESVDMILTSPPYAGAQKYIRASWLSLYWLNLVKLEDIKELKKQNIGREDYRRCEIHESYTGIEDADKVLKELYGEGFRERAFLAANYLNEMKVALNESFRVLKTGGYMVIVIGNNTVCKRLFDTQNYLTSYLTGKGMQLQFKLIDIIKTYGLMTKRNITADTITREWILVFKKG
jgi:DNA modification methylase